MAARKVEEERPNMIETFKEFKDTKSIDRTTLVSVLEESFRNVLAKIFGSDENFDVIVNPDKGDFEIHRNRVVVADGEVQDENKEISLTDARKIEADYEVGEDVSEEVDFNKFGRRAILNLRQTLASKILELEHDSLYNKYKDRVGQIISGEVYQTWKREVLLVDEENNELILPKGEQIPRDQYRKGETVRAVIHRVDNENNNPKIILSRTAPEFLERLLEAEVPEINDGLIAIRKIARMPGERAKIAVESFDERIDQKIFHAEIVVDSTNVSAEMKAYQPIPVIVDFKNEVSSDNLKETIEANYRKVKEEILSLVDSEIMRIKNDPKLAHLIKM